MPFIIKITVNIFLMIIITVPVDAFCIITITVSVLFMKAFTDGCDYA